MNINSKLHLTQIIKQNIEFTKLSFCGTLFCVLSLPQHVLAGEESLVVEQILFTQRFIFFLPMNCLYSF